VARFGEERNEYMVVLEKPEGKMPLGRPRCRWKDYTIKGWRGISWMHLTLIGAIGKIMFEVGKETTVAVKCEAFLNHLRTLILS
jgi:hypothetical protein